MSVAAELQRCRAWIEAALKYSGGTHEFSDIVEAVMNGKMQLWPAPRGCAITEIVVYPRKKLLNVFLAAGELDQVTDGIDAVAAWAKTQGCEGLIMSGRRGWERVLGRIGWLRLHSVMTREV